LRHADNLPDRRTSRPQNLEALTLNVGPKVSREAYSES
jgi:hypothetical protein